MLRVFFFTIVAKKFARNCLVPYLCCINNNKIVCTMTAEDAKKTIDFLFEKIGIGFHPDTPINDYVDHSGNDVFTPEQAETLQYQVDECFEVAGFDPYEYLMQKHTNA